jgi:AcrR family transcriptional regulator
MQTRKRRRTTQEVKDDILNAVGSVLTNQGLSKLGVETVAADANMDKAMLYRHFKNFNDILQTYIDQEDYWIKLLEHTFIEVNNDNLASTTFDLIKEQFEAIFNSSKMQQLLVWELLDKNNVTNYAANKREEVAANILNEVSSIFPHKDVSSKNITAIIVGGIYFLCLHKHHSTFCGVDINNEEEQSRFISDLYWLIERTFSSDNEVVKVAHRCIDKGLDNQLIADITGLSIDYINTLKS